MGISILTINGESVGPNTSNGGTKSFENLSGDFDVTNNGSVFDDTSFGGEKAGGHQFENGVFIA